jgi:hypothetical protein
MDDPRGRLDILLLRLGEAICGRIKAHTGIDLWEGSPSTNQSGLKALTNEFIDECGIPRRPIDIPRTIAALAGKIEDGSSPPRLHPKHDGATHARARRSRRDYV